MIGLPVDKTTLDRTLGTLCQQLDLNFAQIKHLKQWSDNTPQATIETLGYSVDDAYLIKLIIDDLEQLRTLYAGTSTLNTAKDFTTNARKAWGL